MFFPLINNDKKNAAKEGEQIDQKNKQSEIRSGAQRFSFYSLACKKASSTVNTNRKVCVRIVFSASHVPFFVWQSW